MSQSFFYNAQGTSITRGQFNSVLGDQHIHHHPVTRRERKKRTIFDDYENVKRGHICRLRDICQVLGRCDVHYRWGEECQCPREVVKTVCTAKLIGVGGEFTAVSYSGRNARRAFREEFRQLSGQQSSELAQIYAFDDGTVPSMVLWHDLIPLANFASKLSWMGRAFLCSLHMQWDCDLTELWMDPRRGMICRGPEGPPPNMLHHQVLGIEGLPSTSNLIQEETFLQFLASLKSKEADDAFVRSIGDGYDDKGVPELVDRPTVFSDLTKTPIAVANNVWGSLEDNLVEWTYLENGWTRFRLDGDEWLALEWNWGVEEAWLSQAWSVFHARGVSLEDDREGFKLVYRRAWLYGNIDPSPSKCRQQRQHPVFLFVYPPPPDLFGGNTSSLHHWSFYEDGHSQLSPETCCNLGLPVDVRFRNWDSKSYSWSTDHYKTLHHYQLLRGFDPTTTDFARHLGYHHVFQPQNDDDRFEDVCEGQTYLEGYTDLDRSVVGIDPEYRSTMQGSEENSIFGPGISIDNLSPEYSAELNRNAANGQRWIVDKGSGLGTTDTQGYLDQAFRDNSDEYSRGNSYSGVEMGDHLNPRISQHTTVTASNGYESFPTIRPAMVPSTMSEGLEEALDDCDSPLTSTNDPDVEELCALFEWLTIA
ncbi:hypothetical protein PM082_014796 [Marasmius tenuissimus]|nr:hypothetical protein PM082_014796 [Marasmius tenuissimus]